MPSRPHKTLDHELLHDPVRSYQTSARQTSCASHCYLEQPHGSSQLSPQASATLNLAAEFPFPDFSPPLFGGQPSHPHPSIPPPPLAAAQAFSSRLPSL